MGCTPLETVNIKSKYQSPEPQIQTSSHLSVNYPCCDEPNQGANQDILLKDNIDMTSYFICKDLIIKEKWE